MQIKLIPASSHPTILFTIAPPEPPEHLGIAPAWAAQLHRLGAEELEYPPSMLALDKATWIIACLNSVTFDLSRLKGGSRDGSSEGSEGDSTTGEEGPGTVLCHFIDGKVVEWELSERHFEGREALACVEMLQSVCRDVQDSAVEVEKERMRYYVPEPASPTVDSGVPEGAHSQPTAKQDLKKQGKHKKQRSMLLSLVASIISPRSSSQSQPQPQTPARPHVVPPSPPLPSPEPVSIPPSPARFSSSSNLSTELRKRARSTLVDTFRRFVITKLATTLLPVCACIPLQPTYNSHIGYFATWILRSMLDRVEAEMVALVREAGGDPSVYMNTVVHSRSVAPNRELGWQEGEHVGEARRGHQFSTRRVDHALPPSSVPRSPSPPTPPILSSPLPLSDEPISPISPSDGSPSSIVSSTTIAVPQPSFSPTAMTSYTALTTHRLRLRKLLGRHASQADILFREERNLQATLEIKSRRRAWSNRNYMGNDSASMQFLGFAVPTRRSPLGRCKPVCAEDVVVVSTPPTSPINTEAFVAESVNGPGRHRRRPSDNGLVITTAESNIMRLFPVCEEDEEDDEDDGPSYMVPTSRSDLSLVGQCTVGFQSQEDMPSVRLVEDSILRDAEAGLLAPLPLQRHSVPVRPRTRSMIRASPSPLITPPPSPTFTAPSSESETICSSPTSTAFSEVDEEKIEFHVLEPQTKVDLFDVYSGEDDDEDASPGEMGFRSEFTLSMDLPPPYGMDMGMQTMSRKYDKWVVGHHDTSPGGR